MLNAKYQGLAYITGRLSASYKCYLLAQGQSPAPPPLLMCLSAPLDAFQNCQAQVRARCPDGSAECLQTTQHKHARGRRPVRRGENRHTGSTLSAASAALVLLACHTAALAGCRHCRQAQRPNHHTACTHWQTHFSKVCAPEQCQTRRLLAVLAACKVPRPFYGWHAH